MDRTVKLTVNDLRFVRPSAVCDVDVPRAYVLA